MRSPRRKLACLSIVGMQLFGTIAAPAAREPLGHMACLAALADLGVQAEPATIEPAEEDCVVDQPVLLRSTASGRQMLEFVETPTLACGFATVLTRWLAEIAVPTALYHFDRPAAKVLVGPGYACRPRNRQPDAELSVHAFGIALDIRGFELADGEQILIEPPDDADRAAPQRDFLDGLRTSACGYSRPCSARARTLFMKITCTSTSQRTAARTATASASSRNGPGPSTAPSDPEQGCNRPCGNLRRCRCP